MLDVHAPEHGIHGVRDFAVHLLTITAGLLIALGLEQSVEAVHHRHQRKEAEAKIREEISENRTRLMGGAQALQDEIEGMNLALQSLESVGAGNKLPEEAKKKKTQTFSEISLADAAWRTASSTGVLSYMDYDEVEKFSGAYESQEEYLALSKRATDDYLELMPVILGGGGEITSERAKEALPFARSAGGHLTGMHFIGEGTLDAYNAALNR
jgi:hypothetical protein